MKLKYIHVYNFLVKKNLGTCCVILLISNSHGLFKVLLISGGHCLLALCSSLHEFTLLGETIDDSPGEALDKCARMLGLHHLPGLRDVSGGRAIEVVARLAEVFLPKHD